MEAWYAEEAVDKDRLLQHMVEGRLRWDAAVERVPRERRLEPGFEGGWSLKDVIAHIGEWEEVAAARLELGLGRRSSPPDFEGVPLDERNARFHERNRHLPLDEVVDTEHERWQRFLSTVQALDQDQLNDPASLGLSPDESVVEMIADNAHEHFDEHIAQIDEWLGPAR